MRMIQRARAFSMSTLQIWGAVDAALKLHPFSGDVEPANMRALRSGLRMLGWHEDPNFAKKLNPLDVGVILSTSITCFLCSQNNANNDDFIMPFCHPPGVPPPLPHTHTHTHTHTS